MKHGRILFALAALSLSACVQQNRFGVMESNLPVFTSFKKHTNNVDVSTKEYLTIGSDSVKKTTMCRNGDERVYVTVVSAAVVSASHIEIKESPRKVVKYSGGIPCVASLEKSVMAYSLRFGDELSLTPAGGETKFYGYMVGNTPKRLERLKRMAVDAYDAADDEFERLGKAWDKGSQQTSDLIDRTAESVANTMLKVGPLPLGTM